MFNPNELVTIHDYLQQASQLFEQNALVFNHGSDNAWDEALLIVMYVYQLDFIPSKEFSDTLVSEVNRQRLIEIATLRIKTRQPLAYITGEAWFLGERYYVSTAVLIPRSPIAELIAEGFSPWITNMPSAILDLCTGSGCLAIALSKVFTDSRVDAVDISKDAIKIAKQNIELHRCKDRVNLIESDLFAEVTACYDLIVSNPPYVPQSKMLELPKEFSYEPKLALEAGDDGLDIVIRILKDAQQFLTETGIIFVEVGEVASTLQNKFNHVPFTWIDFENGGDGVFMLTKQQLKENFK